MRGRLDSPRLAHRRAIRAVGEIVVVLCILGGQTPAAGMQTRQPAAMSVTDALGIAEFTDRNQVDLSPDGELVAFAMRDLRRAAKEGLRSGYFSDRSVPRWHGETDVYVADVEAGSTRRLSDGSWSSWGPVWSPDGRYLAFYSDRDGLARVWLWDRARDRIVRLSPAIVRPFFGFEQVQWSPDGTQLLVKLLPEGMSFADVERLMPADPSTEAAAPADRTGVTARVYTYSPAESEVEEDEPSDFAIDLDSTRSFLNVELADLGLIDVPSGRVRRLARRVRVMGYRFAPHGDRVAFSTRQPDGGTGMLVYDRYDLSVAETSGGPVRRLASRTIQNYGLQFSWSPNGEQIAHGYDGTIRVLRAEDGDTIRSFRRESVRFEHDYRPPLWLDDNTLIAAARDTIWRLSIPTGAVAAAAVAPGGRQLREIVSSAQTQHLSGPQIMVATFDHNTKRAGFGRLDLATGESSLLFEDDVAFGTSLSYQLDVSPETQAVAFVAERANSPPNIWFSDAGFKHPRRLTDLDPEVSQLRLGSSRLLEWTDASGERLQGALLLPATYEAGKRYPLVVKVYGGSLRSSTVNRFGLESGIDNLQLLATRGYAVLLPDTPLEEGSPLADLAAAVLPGVDSAIAIGVADPDRLALFGHSYGGYSVLAIAVQDRRFRAAISSGGFSDLFSHYAEMREDGSAVGIGWSERGQGRLGGNPWKFQQRYLDNSPFFFLDRITAPVLIVHGGGDAVVPTRHADATFVGLRRLGKEVTLVRYEGEGHHPGEWSLENATDYWDRIFDWLKRHLAPAASQ